MQSFKKPILLWSLATLFFAFQFILRLSVGILREDIMKKFAVDEITFGTLVGYYYLGYSGMQIPIGILLDKFNLKIIIFLSILIASIGTLAFVGAPSWHYLPAARFLIGAGSAVGFLSIAKITKTYFPPERHSIMLGLSFTFGLSGAFFSVTPMKVLFNYFGYNNTFYTLAFTGIIISLMMLMINIKSIKSHDETEKTTPLAFQIFKLLFNPTILLIGIFGGLMVGSLEGFADIWAIPFFKEIYHMNDTDSNLITSCIYIGMCCGGPTLALLFNFFKSSNFMIFLTGLFTIIIFLILFYAPPLSFCTSCIIMFLLGIFCCYQVLVFTVTSNIIEKASAGLAIAIVNCINMSFGYFFHKVISIIIEWSWDGNVNAQGLPLYNKDDFINSIAIIPICCFIGIIGFMFVTRKSK